MTIHVPHHGDPHAPLATVAEAARALPDEDRAVTRQLVLGWRLAGLATVGDALHQLEAMTRDDRRELLDATRAACGLPPAATASDRPGVLPVRRTGPSGSPPTCPAAGCTATPVREGGTFYVPNVRRWWCPAHADQAAPGDLQPRGSGLKLSPSGVPVDDDPAAEQAERDREEARRAHRAAQAAARAAQVAEQRAEREAHEAALWRELPAHLRGGASA